MKQQICPVCKRKFIPSRQPQVHCSISCATSRRLTTVKTLICENCHQPFEFRGRTKAKFCVPCRRIAACRRSIASRVRSGLVQKPGVGSGGNQRGNSNGHGGYGLPKRVALLPSGYRSVARTTRACRTSEDYRTIGLRHYGRHCNVCRTSDKALTVHHRNGDETDHRIENLIPLCYGCHRYVHYVTVPNDQLELRLHELLRNAEVKSQRKSGNPSNGQSEVKVAPHKAASRND